MGLYKTKRACSLIIMEKTIQAPTIFHVIDKYKKSTLFTIFHWSENTISSTCCLLVTLSLYIWRTQSFEGWYKDFFHLYYKYSLYKCLIGAEYYLEPLNAIYERMFWWFWVTENKLWLLAWLLCMFYVWVWVL